MLHDSINSQITPSRDNRLSSSSCFFLTVTGQIESASFSSIVDNLYCRYLFAHGDDWEILNGVNSGLSQIARCCPNCYGNDVYVDNKNGNDNECSIIWNFPIDITFKSTNPYGWPRIAVAVYGLDAFGRDIVRGYGSLLIPISPGRYVKDVTMYRPISGSICNQFMNWIAGTPPEYYDLKFTTQNDGRGVTRVVMEGSVRISISVTTKDIEKFGYT